MRRKRVCRYCSRCRDRGGCDEGGVEHVAYLTLARPDAANTITPQFGREFLATVTEIKTTATVRAVVMTGQGKNFCFGGDLKGMIASGRDIQSYLTELATTLYAGMAQLVRLSAPVVAAVNGTAAGAGLGLALAADFTIAGGTAKFAPA